MSGLTAPYFPSLSPARQIGKNWCPRKFCVKRQIAHRG